MRRIILTAIIGLIGFSLNTAHADHHGYKKITCYETITTYVTKQVPYTKEVVKYDHCGKPYTVCVTCYKDIQVPVKKTIAVTKWVKCD